MKEVWFPFVTWLGWPQDTYRPFAKGMGNLLLSKIGPRILRRPGRDLATVPNHLFLLGQVLCVSRITVHVTKSTGVPLHVFKKNSSQMGTNY
jgi:hypothetical protein